MNKFLKCFMMIFVLLAFTSTVFSGDNYRSVVSQVELMQNMGFTGIKGLEVMPSNVIQTIFIFAIVDASGEISYVPEIFNAGEITRRYIKFADHYFFYDNIYIGMQKEGTYEEQAQIVAFTKNVIWILQDPPEGIRDQVSLILTSIDSRTHSTGIYYLR